MPTYPENNDLIIYIKSLESRIERMERSSQLANSSIEDGSLDVNNSAGITTMQLGRQFDQTYAPVVLTGPVPPTPAGITVTTGERGIIVEWNGAFLAGALAPMDFGFVNAYVGAPGFNPLLANTKHTFTSAQGGKVFIPVPDASYEVSLITYSLAGVASAPSANIAGTASTTPSGNKVTYSASLPGATPNNVNDIWWRYAGTETIGHWIGAGGTSWTATEIGGTMLAATAIDGKVITGATLRTDDAGERVEIVGGGGTPNQVSFHSPGGTLSRIRSNPTATAASGLMVQGAHVLSGINDPVTPFAEYFKAPMMLMDEEEGWIIQGIMLGHNTGTFGLDNGGYVTALASLEMYHTTSTQATLIVLQSTEVSIGGRLDASSMRPVVGVYSDATAVNVTSTSPTNMLARGGDCVFVAPSSGEVIIFFFGLIKAPADGSYISHGVNVREGATLGSGITVGSTYSYSEGAENYSAQYVSTSNIKKLTGLVPGDSYNVRHQAVVQSGTGSFARGRVEVMMSL